VAPVAAAASSWPRDLVALAVAAENALVQTVDALGVLAADVVVLGRRSGEASATLLAERDGLGSSGRAADPASYLGSTGALAGEVLARQAARKASDG